MKQLKFKNQEIPGFLIDENGKIYNVDCVEQKQRLYPTSPYYFFNGHEVHKMMAHSFYGYKEGLVVHHKNFQKRDNRLANLCYLTPGEHSKIHSLAKKYQNMLTQKLKKIK